MNASFNWTEHTKMFHLASLDNTREISPYFQDLDKCLAFHFLILPHSDSFKFCSCMHSFPGQHLQTNQRGYPLYGLSCNIWGYHESCPQ